MKAEEKTKLQKAADSDRARAFDSATNNDFMSAAFHAASALKNYQKLNDGKRIQELKPLLVQYNQKMPPLSKLSVSVPLTDELKDEFNAIVKGYTDKSTLEDNLQTIIRSKILTPDIEQVKKNSKEIRPVTAQFATSMLLDSDGHTKSYDDFETTWLQEYYDIQMRLTHGLLDQSISELVINGQFNRDTIMDIFINKGIFSTDYLLKLDTALERRFEDDYFSAIHILTPLVETTFVTLSRLLELDTITLGRGQVSTSNKPLSSNILTSKKYGETWGEDFCYMISFFMYDQASHRFRHKIAHGDIEMNECNFTTFNLLFYFLSKMTLMIKVEAREFPQPTAAP